MNRRRSLADLDRDLEGLEDPRADHIPEAGLTTVLSTLDGGGTVEFVDADRRLCRINGELRRTTGRVLDYFEWLSSWDDGNGGSE